MSKECSIVRDLLPLYVEDMVSAETGVFVKEHLDGCEACRAEWEGMKRSQTQEKGQKEANGKESPNDKADAAVGDEVAPLVSIQRKLRKQKVKTILCTGLFLIALFVSAFACLSIPVYFPYEADLLTIRDNGGESITITFDERVTDYRCVMDAYTGEEVAEGVRNYQISAWYSLWSKWFSKRGVQSVTIQKGVTEEISVYYTSNDGREDVCVYGEPIISGGVITLPRHVLSYYFVLAVMCTGVLFIIWLFVRRKTKGKTVIETMLYYPISYCIAHVIIAGYRPSTYTSGRDFMFILFISILIYGGVLLARSIYRERKEIKALTERNK